MKITIESTATLLLVNGNPARLWIGRTEEGVEVHFFVAAVSPQTHDAAVNERFARELPLLDPQPRVAQLIDPRFVT